MRTVAATRAIHRPETNREVPRFTINISPLIEF
jgi:hypothetical protein